MKAKKTVSILLIATLLSIIFIGLAAPQVSAVVSWDPYATAYDTNILGPPGYCLFTQIVGMPSGAYAAAYAIIIANATNRAGATDGIVHVDDLRWAMADYMVNIMHAYPDMPSGYKMIYGWEAACGWTNMKIIMPNGKQNMTRAHSSTDYVYNITVEVQNVSDLFGFGLTILWNPAVCKYTGTEGEPPAAIDKIWLQVFPYGDILAEAVEKINNTEGIIAGYGVTLKAGKPTFTGTKALVIIEFKVPGCTYGQNWFVINTNATVATPTGMKNSTKDLIPFATLWAPGYEEQYNAKLEIPKPAPYSPDINNKELTPAYPMECQNATLEWDVTPGFDGDTICPADLSALTLGLPSGATKSPTVTLGPPDAGGVRHATSEFHCNETGVWHISIFARAPGIGVIDPGYVNFTTDICQTFTVLPKVETGIDVYEVRGTWSTPPDPAPGKSGEGVGAPGRPYDPQSFVVLEAYVIYKGDPVQCKIVSFEVRWESEECILYRTDLTGDDPADPDDDDGIARIEFRIPEVCWEYGGPEALFGKWCVIVTVEMCEVKYNDTMWFDMGYILELQNPFSCNVTVVKPPCEGVECVPEELFKKCYYVGFNVTIQNLDWVWHNAVITLVVYDDNEVPIDQCVLQIRVPPGTYCHPAYMTLCLTVHIPKYAYVGEAVGYINCFTALPFECGLAWCPEVHDHFVILTTT